MCWINYQPGAWISSDSKKPRLATETPCVANLQGSRRLLAAALLAFPGASRRKTPTVSNLRLTKSQMKIENIRDFPSARRVFHCVYRYKGLQFILRPLCIFTSSFPST